MDEDWIGHLAALRDELEVYDFFIDLALASDLKFDPGLRNAEHRIAHCQSGFWAELKLRDGRVVVRADSDSLILKGLATAIAAMFTGRRPEEVLAAVAELPERLRKHTAIFADHDRGIAEFLLRIRDFARTCRDRPATHEQAEKRPPAGRGRCVATCRSGRGISGKSSWSRQNRRPRRSP